MKHKFDMSSDELILEDYITKAQREYLANFNKRWEQNRDEMQEMEQLFHKAYKTLCTVEENLIKEYKEWGEKQSNEDKMYYYIDFDERLICSWEDDDTPMDRANKSINNWFKSMQEAKDFLTRISANEGLN